MSQTKNSLIQCISILTGARDEIKILLVDSEHSHLSIGILASLEREISRLEFIGGVQPSTTTKQEFPPITNFLGEDINYPKPLTEDDLSPSELERSNFLTKVNNLYEQIDTLAPDGILNTYTIPEDILVLRGVAKKAGVEGYEEAEINVPFIESIVKAKAAKGQADLENKKIDEELAKQEELTKMESKIKEAESKISALEDEVEGAEEDAKKASANKKVKADEVVKGLKADLEAAYTFLDQLTEQKKQLNA